MKYASALFVAVLLGIAMGVSQQPQVDTLGMHNLTPASGSRCTLHTARPGAHSAILRTAV